MKKIVVIFVVLMVALVLALGGCNVQQGAQAALERCDKNVVLQAANDAELKISADVYEVFVVLGKTDSFSIDYVSHPSVEFSAQVVDGDVVVTETKNGLLDAVNLAIVVTVPQNWRGDADITLVTGAFSANDMAFDDLDISARTGSVTVKNCTAQEVEIHVNTGSVKVDAVAKSLFVEADTAQIKVNGTYENAVHAQTATGSVNVDCTSKQLYATTTSGSVKFATNAQLIAINVGTGSITGTVCGNKEDYTIRIIKNTGSCNLQEQQGKGCLLSVNSDTGSIKINFEK